MLSYLVTLASVLLPNLKDSKAVDKLKRERRKAEQCFANGDIIGAKLAVCDVVFYAALAYHNHLLNYSDALAEIAITAHPMELSLLGALDLAETKYSLRVQNGKGINPQAEREVIASLSDG